MRPFQGSGGLARGFVLGVAVAALVLLSLPVVAAVGDSLLLGKANSADLVTSLSGSAVSNMRLVNSRSGSPALDLQVAAGAPPLKVNSTARVVKLNADLLDGKHVGAFSLAGHNHNASYLGIGATAADATLLDGLDSTAFSLVGHNHNASYLGIGATAADSSLLDGMDSSAFSTRAMACPPGVNPVGYGRSGVLCAGGVGSLTLDAAGDVGWHTSMVLDPFGFPEVSYYDFTNGDLKLVRCWDAACVTGTITTVDSAGAVGRFASLVLDAGGFAIIAYYDTTNGDLKLVRCWDVTCSSRTIRTLDSTGNVGRYTSLTLDLSGFPVVSYYDVTNGDLKLVRCWDVTCSSSTIRTLDSTEDVGLYTSLAVDAFDQAVVSYYDYTNGDLKLVRCWNADCSSSTIRTLDSTEDVGLDTSLALDALGFPVISYYDGTNEDLKVAHCGDESCAAGNTFNVVYSTGDVGWHPSLVLDASGFPVISYYDHTNGDLMVAHCGDATCTAGNTTATVDVTGDVGQFTALVLDAAGHALVSYYDITNGDLKLAGLMG